jgi:hypothetical protein
MILVDMLDLTLLYSPNTFSLHHPRSDRGNSLIDRDIDLV